jgi:hypothetical protein
MKGHDDEDVAMDPVLGLLGAADVQRLGPRVAAIAPLALGLDPDELQTHGATWERVRRAFAVAAERGDALALVLRT